MFNNILLYHCAFNRICFAAAYYALFIFFLTKKRTAAADRQKSQEIPMLPRTKPLHARLDFRANALKYRDLQKLKHACMIEMSA